MNSATSTVAIPAAILPLSMESWPSSGPMVRSSRNFIAAGSAPDRSSTARLVEDSTVKLPVMMPVPPPIWLWMVGAEITLSSSTMANGSPICAAV